MDRGWWELSKFSWEVSNVAIFSSSYWLWVKQDINCIWKALLKLLPTDQYMRKLTELLRVKRKWLRCRRTVNHMGLGEQLQPGGERSVGVRRCSARLRTSLGMLQRMYMMTIAVSVTAERDKRRDMVILQFSLALDLILLNSLTDFVSFLKGHF